jgi:hypothetical protein
MHDFKPFHRYLSRMEETAGTQRLKEAVRHYLIENYPNAPGEPVLAVPNRRRVLHTPLSASEYANVSRSRLIIALRAIRTTGAFPHLPRPTRQLWVPCTEWDPWLRVYGETIIFKEAAPKIGVSPATLLRILDAGWLKPFVAFEKQVPRFHPTDLSEFVERMRQGGHPVEAMDKSMVAIEAAPTVFTLPMIDLLRLVWERQLKSLYLRPELHYLHALAFDRREVNDLLEAPKSDSWTFEEARRILCVATVTMTLLHRQHLIRTIFAPNCRTRRANIMVTPEAMEDFLTKYETLGRLAQIEKRQAKSVLAKLQRLGIEPLPLPTPHSKIFRREDLQPYFS